MSSGFKCRKCYVVVSSQSALVAHYAVAHCRSSCMIPPDHGSLVCPHCDDRYASAEWLSAHLRDAHGVQAAARDNKTTAATNCNDEKSKFKCYVCSKELATQQLLDKHTARIHDSQLKSGPQCDVCKKSFRCRNHLKRHQNTVHGIADVRVFTCQLCSKDFKRKDHLKVHITENCRLSG